MGRGNLFSFPKSKESTAPTAYMNLVHLWRLSKSELVEQPEAAPGCPGTHAWIQHSCQLSTVFIYSYLQYSSSPAFRSLCTHPQNTLCLPSAHPGAPHTPPLSSNLWAGRGQPVHLTLLHAESCVERPTTSCISLPPFWLVPMCIMACLWHPELLQSETFNKRLWNNEFLANIPFLTLSHQVLVHAYLQPYVPILAVIIRVGYIGHLGDYPTPKYLHAKKQASKLPLVPKQHSFINKKIAQPRTKPVGYNTKQILYFSPGYY